MSLHIQTHDRHVFLYKKREPHKQISHWFVYATARKSIERLICNRALANSIVYSEKKRHQQQQ